MSAAASSADRVRRLFEDRLYQATKAASAEAVEVIAALEATITSLRSRALDLEMNLLTARSDLQTWKRTAIAACDELRALKKGRAA